LIEFALNNLAGTVLKRRHASSKEFYVTEDPLGFRQALGY